MIHKTGFFTHFKFDNSSLGNYIIAETDIYDKKIEISDIKTDENKYFVRVEGSVDAKLAEVKVVTKSITAIISEIIFTNFFIKKLLEDLVVNFKLPQIRCLHDEDIY